MPILSTSAHWNNGWIFVWRRQLPQLGLATPYGVIWLGQYCLRLACCPLPGPNLTHWGQLTHICASKITIIGSDNGLSPDRCQAVIWTNTRILLIETFGTNFNEIVIKIHAFSFKKVHLKTSSGNRRHFCHGLKMLTNHITLANELITPIYSWYMQSKTYNLTTWRSSQWLELLFYL